MKRPTLVGSGAASTRAAALGDWLPAPASQHLDAGVVHVWRIAIDHEFPSRQAWSVLARGEQARALRLKHPVHQAAYIFAHGAMRTILAAYQQLPPSELRFTTADSGKPALPGTASLEQLEFSLSHSGHLAL